MSKLEARRVSKRSATRERGKLAPASECHQAAPPADVPDALASAHSKINRLRASGFALSRNNRKIILYGQLTTLAAPRDAACFVALVDAELSCADRRVPCRRAPAQQLVLFERT